MGKIDSLFMIKSAKNHAFWSLTYLCSLYKEVPPHNPGKKLYQRANLKDQTNKHSTLVIGKLTVAQSSFKGQLHRCVINAM